MMFLTQAPHRAQARTDRTQLPVTIVETQTDYRIRLDVPGIDPQTIQITLEDGALKVQCERLAISLAEDQTCHLDEIRAGALERTFRLPREVDPEGIEARHELGVLEITLTKVMVRRTVPITIK